MSWKNIANKGAGINITAVFIPSEARDKDHVLFKQAPSRKDPITGALRPNPFFLNYLSQRTWYLFLHCLRRAKTYYSPYLRLPTLACHPPLLSPPLISMLGRDDDSGAQQQTTHTQAHIALPLSLFWDTVYLLSGWHVTLFWAGQVFSCDG